jgi:ABC-type uncharacterized transport system substrate-binding protein
VYHSLASDIELPDFALAAKMLESHLHLRRAGETRRARGKTDMPMGRLRPLTAILAALLLCAGLAARVDAHPHVFITFETTVLYDKGTFVGVAHKWTFDEYYTTMAIEGLDKNNDGVYDREELSELAKVNIDGLKDFSYFTFPALAGKELALGEARDYWLEHKGGLLSLFFTVPFASPVLAEAKGLTVSVYDPTYFIAFDLAKTDPIKMSKEAPKGCVAKVAAAAQTPGEKAALEALQTQLGAFATGIAKTIVVECSAP